MAGTHHHPSGTSNSFTGHVVAISKHYAVKQFSQTALPGLCMLQRFQARKPDRTMPLHRNVTYLAEHVYLDLIWTNGTAYDRQTDRQADNN
jgi:hypothetical protein